MPRSAYPRAPHWLIPIPWPQPWPVSTKTGCDGRGRRERRRTQADAEREDEEAAAHEGAERISARRARSYAAASGDGSRRTQRSRLRPLRRLAEARAHDHDGTAENGARRSGAPSTASQTSGAVPGRKLPASVISATSAAGIAAPVVRKTNPRLRSVTRAEQRRR